MPDTHPFAPPMFRAPALLLAAVLLAAALALPGCSNQATRDYEAGEKAMQAGRQDQARELLDAAIGSGELSEPVLARALHYRAVIRLSNNEFARAEQDATAALSHSLRNAETYLVRGMARLARDHADQAVEDFDAALAIDPGNPAALTYRGQVRLERDEADKAVDDLTQVIESKRATRGLLGRALFIRGQALASLDRDTEALADMQRAAGIDPGSDLALAATMRAAELQAKAGDTAAAEQSYTRVIRQRPDLADGYRRRGLLRYLGGRYAAAADDFERGLAAAPGDPDLLNQLAWLLATAPDPAARDGARAVRLAQRAVDASGANNPMYVDTLAAALAEAGRFREAVTAQETAVAMLEAANQNDLLPEFRQRLALFKSRRAYHAAPKELR